MKPANSPVQTEVTMNTTLTPFRQWCRENGLSAQTAYRESAAGRLRIVKVGRKSYIRPEDSAAWAAALKRFESRHASRT